MTCEECDDTRVCWHCHGNGLVTYYYMEVCQECEGSGVCLMCLIFQRVTAEEAARITSQREF